MFWNVNLGTKFWDLHHFSCIKKIKSFGFPNFSTKLKEIWTQGGEILSLLQSSVSKFGKPRPWSSKLWSTKKTILSTLQTSAQKFGALKDFLLLALLSFRPNYGRLIEKMLLALPILRSNFKTLKTKRSWHSRAQPQAWEGQENFSFIIPNFGAKVWNTKSQKLLAIGGAPIFWSSIYGREVETKF